jgi:hypothetical protein
MIYFIGSPRPAFETYLASWGQPLAKRIQMLSYEDLFSAKMLGAGSYILSAIDLLCPADAERAAAICAQLVDSGHDVLLLNHPTLSMRRYELLRTLKERGINTFDVYRATEARWPTRFPVFLRRADSHQGAVTPLLFSRRELEAAIEDLARAGTVRDDHLIVEFCDTADRRGIYRKYSAFVLGSHVIPVHIAFSTRWITKGLDLLDEDLLLEERNYVMANPHETVLRAIFAVAKIAYGRIDYGMVDGRPQVWEINTDPHLIPAEPGTPLRQPVCEHSAKLINAALSELDLRADSAIRIANPIRRQWVRAQQCWFIHTSLAMCRLTRWEPTIMRTLAAGHRTIRRLVAGDGPA